MAVLEGFKKVSIALVGAFGLAGAVFFGFKVAELCSSGATGTGLLEELH
jgi:hypothetical protein